MQPLIVKRRKYLRRGSLNNDSRAKVGEIIAYQCGDCSGRWKRHRPQKHAKNCPRALRNSLEHQTMRAYCKRAPAESERSRLMNATNAARKLLEYEPIGEVEIHMRNRHNPNGWTVRLKAGDSKSQVSRSISMAWARQRGYVDAQER